MKQLILTYCSQMRRKDEDGHHQRYEGRERGDKDSDS